MMSSWLESVWIYSLIQGRTDIFQGVFLGFGEEEPSSRNDYGEVHNGKEDVGAESDIGKHRSDDHDHWKVSRMQDRVH